MEHPENQVQEALTSLPIYMSPKSTEFTALCSAYEVCGQEADFTSQEGHPYCKGCWEFFVANHQGWNPDGDFQGTILMEWIG